MPTTFLDSISSTGVFHSRGSIPLDKPTYVPRHIDAELISSIKEGNFSYLFAARDMGKTSLRVRLSEQLQNDGWVCSFADMSALGTNIISPDQWYYTYLFQVCRGLGLTSKLKSWWREDTGTTPADRVIEFFQTVVLAEVPENIVIWIDEAEAVLTQDENYFNNDDFFAIIRSLYNARTDNPGLNRLNFVVMGVSTPMELIKDQERSPFPIGKEFILDNLALEESAPLEVGLEYFDIDRRVFLQEVFYWTSGQPFLTQRICEAVVKGEDKITNSKEVVYAYTNDLYLKKAVTIESDPHLLAIQNKILRSEHNTKMLGLYQEIYNKQFVVYSPEDITHRTLMLSGLVRIVSGHLAINNNIYKAKFDLDWIGQQLKKFDRPFSADLNRWLSLNKSRSAALKGEVLRQALNWASDRDDLSPLEKRYLDFSRRVEKEEERRKRRILILMLILAGLLLVLAIYAAIYALGQKKVAEDQSMIAMFEQKESLCLQLESDSLRRVAEGNVVILEEAKKETEDALVLAEEQRKIAVAASALAKKNARIADSLRIIALRQAETADSLRGVAQDRADEAKRLSLLAMAQSLAYKATLNFDDVQMNGLLAMQAYKFNNENGGSPYDAAVYEALRNAKQLTDSTYKNKFSLKTDLLSSFVFAEQNTMIAMTLAGDLVLYNMESGNIIGQRKVKTGATVPVNRSFLFPMAGMVILGYEDGSIYVSKLGGTDVISTRMGGHTGMIRAADISPGNQTVATGGRDAKLFIWSTANFTTPIDTFTLGGSVRSVKFSNDGKYVFTADESGAINRINIVERKQDTLAVQQGKRALSLAISPDNKMLAVGYNNGLVELYDLETLKLITPINNAGDIAIDFITIDKKSEMMAVANADGVVKVYRLHDLNLQPITIKDHDKKIQAIEFHEDGRVFALCRDNQVRYWETDINKLAKDMCNNLSRNLTSEEWVREVGDKIPYDETCNPTVQ